MSRVDRSLANALRREADWKQNNLYLTPETIADIERLYVEADRLDGVQTLPPGQVIEGEFVDDDLGWVKHIR